MEKALAKLIQDRAEAAIRAAFAADPMLKHIRVTPVGGSLGTIDATLKFSFIDTTAQTATPFGGNANEDSLRLGLAPPGMKVLYGGKTYTIIKARNIKYLAQCEDDGKNYLIRFIGCRPASLAKA